MTEAFEAFELTVYQRSGRVFVDPSVMSPIGLQGLNEVIEVARLDELEPALELALQRVDAARARPERDRFAEGTPVWEVAGCTSWQQFVSGTRVVGVLYLEDETRVESSVPDPRSTAFLPGDDVRVLPPMASVAEVADAVRSLLGRGG